MKREDHTVVPDSLLTKEFLSQFKTEDDVSKFLSKLHCQVLEKMLEGEMDVHLGYGQCPLFCVNEKTGFRYFSYICILFANIRINWFIINPQL